MEHPSKNLLKGRKFTNIQIMCTKGCMMILHLLSWDVEFHTTLTR